MSKSYYSLGLMSGTSMDGVDASIIQSDGETKYKTVVDRYFEYPLGIYNTLTKLRDKIKIYRFIISYYSLVYTISLQKTIGTSRAYSFLLTKM